MKPPAMVVCFFALLFITCCIDPIAGQYGQQPGGYPYPGQDPGSSSSYTGSPATNFVQQVCLGPDLPPSYLEIYKRAARKAVEMYPQTFSKNWGAPTYGQVAGSGNPGEPQQLHFAAQCTYHDPTMLGPNECQACMQYIVQHYVDNTIDLRPECRQPSDMHIALLRCRLHIATQFVP